MIVSTGRSGRAMRRVMNLFDKCMFGIIISYQILFSFPHTVYESHTAHNTTHPLWAIWIASLLAFSASILSFDFARTSQHLHGIFTVTLRRLHGISSVSLQHCPVSVVFYERFSQKENILSKSAASDHNLWYKVLSHSILSAASSREFPRGISADSAVQSF